MTKLAPHIITLIAGFLLGALAFWKGCDREPDCPEFKKIDSTSTSTVKIDLVIAPELVAEIPKPYKVTEYIPTEPDPPDFTLDKMREYVDTVVFDGLTLGYEITTRGELKGAIFRPTFERETITNTVTITEREEAKPLRGLYVGGRIGGNLTQFSSLAPKITYVTPKKIYGVDYNPLDKSVNVDVGIRLFSR